MTTICTSLDEAFAVLLDSADSRRRERISTALEYIRAGATMLRGDALGIHIVGASAAVMDALVLAGADASVSFDGGEMVHVCLPGGSVRDAERVDVTACRPV